MRNQLLLLIICLLSFATLLLVALLRNSFAMIDLHVNSWAISIQTGSLTATAIVIAYLFNTTSMAGISLAIAIYLFYRNYKKYGVLLLAAMGGDALIVWITKTLIHSSRPSNGIFYEAGYSFPSGHTTASIAFCGLLTYFVWQHWASPKAKTASSTLSIATISMVAFDRIYLNVHWFSDVVGGLLLGIFWLTLTLWIFRYAEKIESIHGFNFLCGAGALKTRMVFFFQEAKSQLDKREQHNKIGRTSWHRLMINKIPE